MKLIINEQQEQLLIKEFIQQGFSLAELDSLDHLAKQRLYCEQHLGDPIGEGSGRVVFETGEGEVIKLAKEVYNNTGLKQNRLEYNNYISTKSKYPQLNSLFPKVFQIADNSSWLTCERVLPAESIDFQTILGVPYSSFLKNDNFKEYEIEKYDDEFGLDLSVVEFIDWAESIVRKEPIEDLDINRAYKQLLKSNEWFKQLYQYIKLEGSGFGDLQRENFGIAMRNGKPTIVILDNGFDNLTESKKISKRNLKEHLDKYYGIPLKKCFTSDGSEQDNQRINAYYYKFASFLLDNNLDSALTDDECFDLMMACKHKDKEGVLPFIEEFGDEIKRQFAQWIKKETMKPRRIDFENKTDLPIGLDIASYIGDVYNKWVVHFTNNAYSIIENGFKYATNDLNKLGYTNAGEIEGKTLDGYNFGYLSQECPIDGDKYGYEAVMFITSGIKVYHKGDEEEQVIFPNNNVKNLIYIENGEFNDNTDKWFVSSRINGNVLYSSNDINKLTRWVEDNFAQYRKHLTK